MKLKKKMVKHCSRCGGDGRNRIQPKYGFGVRELSKHPCVCCDGLGFIMSDELKEELKRLANK